MSKAKTLLEVGDKIEERAMLRVKDGGPTMRVRQGWRKAEVIAVVDEPEEGGTTVRVALIRRVDGDEITGWDALLHDRWMSDLWRYAEDDEDLKTFSVDQLHSELTNIPKDSDRYRLARDEIARRTNTL